MDKKELTQMHCVPCRGEDPPISEDEMEELKPSIPDWEILERNSVPRLHRTFKFPDFKEALDFTNKIGDLAEREGHHPVITTTWGRVTVEWWTHVIHNLHKNDFIMAAYTDDVYDRLS
jgi:4a-hydroxytetrahydrobiopterin dehydratase